MVTIVQDLMDAQVLVEEEVGILEEATVVTIVQDLRDHRSWWKGGKNDRKCSGGGNLGGETLIDKALEVAPG